MTFESSRFPRGGPPLPNIQATGRWMGRYLDESGAVTGHANAVLTKAVASLTWEALAYLETTHRIVASQEQTITRTSQDLATVARTVELMAARVSEMQAQLAQLVGDRVAIPAWVSMEEVEQGDEMQDRPSAEHLGLRVGFEQELLVPGMDHLQVVRIDPAPGSLVAKGSFVVVTVNSEIDEPVV